MTEKNTLQMEKKASATGKTDQELTKLYWCCYGHYTVNTEIKMRLISVRLYQVQSGSHTVREAVL